MKLLGLILVVALGMFPSAFSEAGYVIYLKDGSTLSGQLVNNNSGDSVSILTEEGETVQIDENDIEMVTRMGEEHNGAGVRYYNLNRFNFLPSSNQELSTVHGLKFGDNFAMGLGAGILNSGENIALTFLLNTHIALFDCSITPTVNFDIGYSSGEKTVASEKWNYDDQYSYVNEDYVPYSSISFVVSAGIKIRFLTFDISYNLVISDRDDLERQPISLVAGLTF
ncbi:MAG: hypothetical protein NT002_00920 [candidate division Zixibacteria bacterium]|nr:hypothetical protein [candidate division Zixibacteria bacterium]